MSRLGKKEIIIPEEVKVEIKDRNVSVSGPKGQLDFPLGKGVDLEIEGGKIFVKSKLNSAMHGTTRQILSNMIVGVIQGWSKTLEVVGTGFRVVLEGSILVFSLGFSHKVRVEPPEGISFSVSENKVVVAGRDKALVGKVAAEIRQLRPPDAYKGKGIRYAGERVRLKMGKATKAGGMMK